MQTKEQEFIQFKDIYLALQEKVGVPKQAILVPKDEKVYRVDLNARTIEAPEFLAVYKDHHAETIYFILPRYFDNVDLSQQVCVIQYINAAKERRLFAVPFVDVETRKGYDEMIIPWVVDQGVACAVGGVSFAFKFYRLTEDGSNYEYNLNTLPSTSKVLNSITMLTEEPGIDGVNNYPILEERALKLLEILDRAEDSVAKIDWLDL